MTQKEITLTGAQLKELKLTGHTSKEYGGINYIIESVGEQGLPVVVGAEVLSKDFPAVNFPGILEFYKDPSKKLR